MATVGSVMLVQTVAIAGSRFDEHWHANNIRAARATKKALLSRLRIVPPFPNVADISTGAAAKTGAGAEDSDAERARRLSGVEALMLSSVLPARPPYPPRAADDFSKLNDVRRVEYFTYYDENGYSMAGSDLEVEVAARLVHDVFRLGPADSLLDLGSSTGVLCLVTACLSEARIAGVELSPSRVAHGHAMQAALAQLRPDAASRLELRQGDLLLAPLADYNVLFCAVQPVAALKLMPTLLTNLLHAHRNKRAGGCAPRQGDGRLVELRFFCAGFDLPLDVKGVVPSFVCGHTFAPRAAESTASHGGRSLGGSEAVPEAAEGAEAGEDIRGVPMYGSRGEGPRVVLEYMLTLDLDAELEGALAPQPEPGARTAAAPAAQVSAVTSSES